MYLLFDLSSRDIVHLALFDSGSIEHKKYSGMNRELLSSVDDFLKLQNIKKEDVGGIMVVVGAGSFTSTRIACVVANTFAYVLQVPLLAIGEDKIDSAQDLIPELLKQTKGQYISATYSGEPNIGKKKK
ncbi:MAG: hypothetical protein HOA57_00830 [Candidatus Magasanikbacteria bacterium]|jgi:tRNA A37 threonylcarbamoyladenosine modification protein TsaB|nr:hypothetical protein [Candidatus Magasanikbacteria bacterium]MBT4314479.1 hypothetical protein [Candidatus Magasanikbacteria bacterium]MBT4547315.1 hypothetical protein [Candidatus Magasanikbacteria bacterium]MBT6818916.1 hypothetical protein [Candidatus Magasanikbacteria bacterium]